MAVIPLGDPYYEDASLQDIDLADMTPEQLALVHTDAPHRGNKFIFLFMLANLGAVIAYGPTYGIFIELSQREPEHIRGRLQTNVFMVRNALAIVTAFLTGLCLNSTEYGGTFSWTIGFNGIMWICTAATVITIPFCWFCVTEEKVEQAKSIGTFYSTRRSSRRSKRSRFIASSSSATSPRSSLQCRSQHPATSSPFTRASHHSTMALRLVSVKS
ncbi:uncharacterized protein PITG_01993 [Phytophthora infestans T30-4]|uniref:Transmembrane protein, putative n=1 Tax=Phytophthora infestans (strain T30-4) TaxID=403677 RepID=D0MUL4_PHYIT|nr:uncharacterized protein PITG_01993 [Phytophthora infestans T30-4]EEY61661.1 transmembrane protein, putative [Phytophthora infestans T30-4]|eukprot:XP_002908578.1 transmembrane protein, putative [Phytophthora infestans T30-4]